MIKFLKDLWRDISGAERPMRYAKYSIRMVADRCWVVSRRDSKGWIVLEEKKSKDDAELAVAKHCALDAQQRELRRQQEESTMLFDQEGNPLD